MSFAAGNSAGNVLAARVQGVMRVHDMGLMPQVSGAGIEFAEPGEQPPFEPLLRFPLMGGPRAAAPQDAPSSAGKASEASPTRRERGQLQSVIDHMDRSPQTWRQRVPRLYAAPYREFFDDLNEVVRGVRKIDPEMTAVVDRWKDVSHAVKAFAHLVHRAEDAHRFRAAAMFTEASFHLAQKAAPAAQYTDNVLEGFRQGLAATGQLAIFEEAAGKRESWAMRARFLDPPLQKGYAATLWRAAIEQLQPRRDALMFERGILHAWETSVELYADFLIEAQFDALAKKTEDVGHHLRYAWAMAQRAAFGNPEKALVMAALISAVRGLEAAGRTAFADDVRELLRAAEQLSVVPRSSGTES